MRMSMAIVIFATQLAKCVLDLLISNAFHVSMMRNRLIMGIIFKGNVIKTIVHLLLMKDRIKTVPNVKIIAFNAVLRRPAMSALPLQYYSMVIVSHYVRLILSSTIFLIHANYVLLIIHPAWNAQTLDVQDAHLHSTDMIGIALVCAPLALMQLTII